MGPSSRRLSSQILRMQVLILAGTLVVGVLLALYAARDRLDREYEMRALGIARTIAATPELVAAAARNDRSGFVQRRAEAIRRATGASNVVLANRRGIRLSHSRPEFIGRPVGTDPTEVLAGRTVLAVQSGGSGISARARVPLRDERGGIVGLVTVTVARARIHQELVSALPVFALYAAGALTIGLAASLLLARRLKRQTFGLELREIAGLLQEREATLFGIREGVLSVGPDGRVQMANSEARRLLGLSRDPVGEVAADIAPEGSRLDDVLEGRVTGDDLLLVHGDRVLVANRMPVTRDGRDLGVVITLRDRTELEALARELDSLGSLTDALRAQAHEFSNRAHTIAGLLKLGHYDDAIDFISEISAADSRLRQFLGERVADPRAAALLLAKSTVANERGVELRLAPDLELDGELNDVPAFLTVLGNLIDNAMDAARSGGERTPWVELSLATDADDALHLRVTDSGPGIPPQLREKIFEPGYTTKPPPTLGERGVGLSLVRRMLERRGGHIEVAEAAGGGARFDVFLPEAVRRTGSPGLIATEVVAP